MIAACLPTFWRSRSRYWLFRCGLFLRYKQKDDCFACLPKLSYIHAVRPQIPKKFNSIRSEGFITLFLSNIILVLTAGLSGLWAFRVIYVYARDTDSGIADKQTILLVLGKFLINGKPDHDYTQRLNRARHLLKNQSADRVAILGGITGKLPVSEAAAGRSYLIEQGVADQQILVEDQSRHTLENLQLAREMLAKHDRHSSNHAVILISNRYHLARAHAMASGMKIDHGLCAAEERWNISPRLCLKLFLEAYYLHWYYAGKYWSIWTNNKKWLRRIT